MRTFLFVAACVSGTALAGQEPESAAASFWSQLSQHCGQAFEGRRVIARDDRPDLLQGDERLIVHFRSCTDDVLALPFHIGMTDGSWDRSRTWLYSWHGEQLELRHDHRLPSGEPDHEGYTMYGGVSIEQGTAEVQRFLYTKRTADDGSALGWQIEIVPGERYTYGNFRGEDWTWRLDFDLSQPLAEVPPAPWGHE